MITKYLGKISRPSAYDSIIVALMIYGVIRNIMDNSSYDSSYHVGEWLISYAGGFVRRGLPGSIIFFLARNFSFQPVLIVQIISVATYISLSVVLCRLADGKIDHAVILSPYILLFPLLSDNLIRKDVVGILVFSACIWLLISPKRAHLGKRWFRVIAVNILCVSAVLTHEAFGFYGLPAIVAIHLLSAHQDSLDACHWPRFVTHLRNSFLAMAPAILAMIACLLVRGDGTHALAIHRSWISLKHLFPPSQALDHHLPDPDGAIGAIGWTLDTFFIQTSETLTAFEGILWVPAAWLVTIYLGASILRSSISKTAQTGLAACRPVCLPDLAGQSLITAILGFQLISCLPLFMTAIDYGRWIFIWSSTAVIMYCQAGMALASFPGFVRGSILCNQKIARLFLALEPGRVRMIVLWIGIPTCCWSVLDFYRHSPVGYVLTRVFG